MLNPKTGKKWRLFVAIPSNGSVSDFQPCILRDLQELYSDEIEFVYPPALCQRMFHDAAREGLVQDFLDSGCDVMWFLDSDICPPRHVLDLLVRHGDKWLCAGAPYPVFMAQPGQEHRQIVFTCYKQIPNSNPIKIAPCPIPYEGIDFIDGIATGCLFIKREVFDRLEKPYFQFKYDETTRAIIEGEDIGFCLKMAKLGIKFFVDYSMLCRHYKNNIDLLEINNFCLDFTNKILKSEIERREAELQDKLTVISDKYNKIKNENKELKQFILSLKKEYEEASGLITPPPIVSSSGKPLIYR